MPKYIPNDQDLYTTGPCPICGVMLQDEKSKTCGNMLCEQQLKYFEEDMYDYFMDKIYLNEDDEYADAYRQEDDGK